MTLAFYTRYALRSLVRGGQRTLLALLCVAFGVMSLVAMQLLAGMIHATVVGDPRGVIGGDAFVRMDRLQPFSAAQLATLDRLRAGGTLTAVSLQAQLPARAIKPAGTGQVYFLAHSPRGVDPATYPLVGSIPLREPAGTTFGAAITPPLHAVITRDLADQLGLRVGDRFTLIGTINSATPELQVGGIAQDVPDRQGDGILYSLDTAHRLTGAPQVVDSAVVTWPAAAPATAALQAAGLALSTAAAYASDPGDAGSVFDFMLKAAGILGLIVGGIGVANTLQVTLARRTLEIAALKTLGYQRRDLLALFGVETALLGLIGGIIGALVALAVAGGLVTLLGRTGLFLLPWIVDPRLLAGGVLAGALTAVIFGLSTIVRASSVRPAVLLREQPVRRGWRTNLAGFGLLLVLVVLFSAISGLVMDSPVAGVEVIGAAIAGLIGLTLLFGGTLFLLLRLPLPRLPMLTLARQNLKRQSLRAVFPLIALFMGVFTIGFATGTLVDAFNRVAAGQQSASGYNLIIYSRQTDAGAIAAGLARQGVADVHAHTTVAAQVRTAAGAVLPSVTFLDGRAPADADWEAQVTAGGWTGAADAALLPGLFAAAPWSLHIGDPLTVAAAAGPATTLHIAGFYTPRPVDSPILPAADAAGLLVSQATAVRLGGAASAVTFVATVPAARLPAVEAALGPALPQATIVSTADLTEALGRRIHNLLDFVVGIAGLALVAGTILIANGVGLALIERRREMGILKAVGFTAGRVLGMLAVENSLLGLLAGVLGMGAVAVAMALINIWRPAAQLSLDPGLAALMVGISVALTLGTTALVAWQPTHVRPLDVLRTE